MSSSSGFESSRVSADSRAGLIYLAKLAEQAERFDDMKVRLVLFLSLPHLSLCSSLFSCCLLLR